MPFSGGTPYPEIQSSNDLVTRLMRGLRLPKPVNVSDGLYQLMLDCWQIDLDERPSFSEILQVLGDMDSVSQFNYSVTPNFAYAKFSNELELA